MVAEYDARADRRVRIAWGARRVLLFVALFALLLVIGGLALPAATEDTEAGLLLGSALTLAAAVVAGAVLLIRLDDRSAGALGLAWNRAVPREIGLGMLTGMACIGLAAALMTLTGGLRYAPQAGGAGSWLSSVGFSLGALAVPAFAEEALFRGYAFQVTARVVGPVAATLGVSALFALAHAGNPAAGALGLVNIFFAGVLLSAAYLRTRSLWFAGALHLGWNWGMAGLLDLPVSGLEIFDTPLYEPVVTGAGWLGGGPFGPEGGVVGTIAFAVALVAVLKLPGLNEAPAMRALRPIIDTDEDPDGTGE